MPSVADFLGELKAYGQSLDGAPPIDIFSGGFTRSSAPFVIGKAGLEAERLLDSGLNASFRQFAEGFGSAERERRDQSSWALAEAGVDPLMARNVLGEQDAGRGSEVAGFRAALEQARAEGKTGILSEVTSGLVQSEQYQDSLDLQKYIADQQAKAAKKAGLFSMIGNLGGAALNLFAPGAGLGFGSMFGGLFGGGGKGGGQSSGYGGGPYVGATGGGMSDFNFGFNSPFPLGYNALEIKPFLDL